MALTLISTHTASADSSIDITSGITSTYDSYEWHFVNMHPATDEVWFQFQVNADGASGFNETITSTYFKAEHSEGGAGGSVAYSGGNDQAEGTAFQRFTYSQQMDTDEAASGILRLYAPSSTTFAKHFQATGNYVHHSGHYSQNFFVGGYVNTTTAIDEIRFMMESGDINAGEIKMYGIKKS